MRRVSNILCAATLLLSAIPLSAQTMSLRECVDYAIAHNTNIEQQRLNEENRELTLQTSRFSRLPSLNASMDQSFGFGRSAQRDGTTVDRNSASTSFNVSTSVPIFTGFRIPNQIKADKYSLMAATAQLEKARRDVSVQVAGYYLQALYYRGLLEVQRQQVALDEEALSNARILFETGKRPASEVATAEAQVAVSRHSLTEAEGNEMMARLDLMQLLNLQGDVRDFAIQEVDTNSLNADVTPAAQVFASAVEGHPAILAAKYNLESSRYQLKVAKSRLMPDLSLGAGYGTSYYHQFDADNMDFSRQLDINGSERIGLSLSVPIFNRFQTRNSVRQARLSILSQELALTQARQSLDKEIQQAYWNAIKARENLASAQKAHASTSLAYQYESEKYAAGRGTAYDLQQARQRMAKSSQDEVQARYEYLMRVKILDFYNGVEL